jgi:predicted flavoprotein YhiN
MKIDKKTAEKVIVRSIAKEKIAADKLMQPSKTPHQDFAKNADKLLKTSTAKTRLGFNLKKRGLLTPTDKNRAKAVNRLVSQMKKGEVNLDRGDRMSRHIDIHERNQYVKSYNKGVFARKVIKNMGKLSVPGVIATIMQPKKVGDATLYGNQGEYKKVK